jgi:hypothetical protein
MATKAKSLRYLRNGNWPYTTPLTALSRRHNQTGGKKAGSRHWRLRLRLFEWIVLQAYRTRFRRLMPQSPNAALRNNHAAAGIGTTEGGDDDGWKIAKTVFVFGVVSAKIDSGPDASTAFENIALIA